MAINYTPMTAVSGNVLTAAQWNTEVRDFSTGVQSAYTSYTPALSTTGTAITMGSGSSATGSYQRFGKSTWGTAEIVAGSSGFAAGTGTYRISLPVAATAGAVAGGRIMGEGVFFDNSVGTWYHLMLVASTTTTCTMVLDNTVNTMSATAPVVPANSDQWRVKFEYEAA